MGREPFLDDEADEGGERLFFTEEPRLGDDHGLDEIVPFGRGIPEECQIGIMAAQAEAGHARADRVLHDR